MPLYIALLLLTLCLPAYAQAATYYVATTGSDAASGTRAAPWQTISHAVTAMTAGDTILVRGGVYNETVAINTSGTAANPITLKNYPGETPILDGSGLTVPADDSGLVLIKGQGYISITGFTLRNYTTTTRGRTPIGIHISQAAHDITISDCTLHDIGSTATVDSNKNGRDAHGILISGDSATPISNITITACTLRNLTLGSSEALAVNGNVDGFIIEENTLYDLDNIGIDAIGHEDTSPDTAQDYARNGIIRNNTISSITSWQNPAYGEVRAAGGIYVDGGTDIDIENNTIHHCDIGVEIASEHAGYATTRVTVRSNFLYQNNIAGLAMGGYDTKRGSTTYCTVTNNTLALNDTYLDGNGEVLLQYDVRNNVIKNNIILAGSQGLFIGNNFTLNEDNDLDYNLYYTEAYGEWQWKKTYYDTFSAYQAASGQDSHSMVADPLIVSMLTPDLHITADSPARDAGVSLTAPGTKDIDGQDRIIGSAIDIGADEYAGAATPAAASAILMLLGSD